MTDGFKKVQKMLKALPTDVQRKVVTKAGRKAGKLIADEAKRRVAVRSGLLKKSIVVRQAKQKDTPKDTLRYYIVPLSRTTVRKKVTIGGQKATLKAKLHAYHGHFLEFGTTKMKAKPFLLPSARAMQSKVVRVFEEEMIVGIERILK